MPIFNMISGGGGTGGTLTVTAPANTTVTISNGDKTKSKTSDANGTAIFKGLETGTWTVTITNGTQTTTKTVDITADYAMVIAFFAATIAVTYPKGSTLTCTDGSTTMTATTTTGSYTFTVPNAGTWTVSCTDGTNTASNSVSITEDGVTVSVTLEYDLWLAPSKYAYRTDKKQYGSPSVSGDTVSVSYTTSSDYPGEYSECLFVFTSTIDVTKYSTLQATVNVKKISDTAGTGKLYLGVTESSPSSVTYHDPSFIASTNTKSTGTGTLSVSLSSVNKSVYICVFSKICKATITNIKLIV